MVKKTRKLNLVRLFDNYSRMTNYDNFIKNKVIPIIGEKAVHKIVVKGVTKYGATERNFNRVAKSLGITVSRPKVKKVDNTAFINMFKEALSSVIQPTTPGYPISYRIPIHPISHNKLYKAVRGRFVRDPVYSAWRNNFFPLIHEIASKSKKGVDFTKPLDVKYKFGHREKSDAGYKFDRPNFQKAAQDCIFEFFESDDTMVLESSITGEFVETYGEGYIEFSIRNT